MRIHDGQIGALAAVDGKISVLDHVSRPDVFSALHGPLVQGYALDALEAGDAPAPSVNEAAGFPERVMAARVSEQTASASAVTCASPNLASAAQDWSPETS